VAILHADLDSFYASVEQRDDPSLLGRPVIVGPGVVLAASYEAKARGVSSGMGAARARRLCPDAVVVPCRMEAYSEASRAVFEIFEDTAPVVEALSIDEAFLDVRGMEHFAGTPMEIAERLRRRVRAELGLPISVGVARTKFLAKVASAVAKPDGLLVVPADGELAFLHPLPVERLWGVGPATAERLHAAGLRSVGQVAEAGQEALVDMLGRAVGRQLHSLALGRDPRRVQVRRRRRSIGAQHALGRRSRSPDAVDAILVGLVDRVSGRMRRARRVCRTVVLRLRFADFSRATRSHTLSEPTARTATLLATARELLDAAGPAIDERGITLVGVALTNLADANAGQLELGGDPAASLDRTLDDLRERFGKDAITRAVLLDHEEGPRDAAPAGLAPGRLRPATPCLGPLREVVRRAERVRDAVLAPVAHEQHLHVAELLAAVGAALDRVVGPARLLDVARLPVGAAKAPRDHVLEAAERRAAGARDLLRAPALLALDPVAAPGACLCRLRRHARR
jgi:DNA polymerase-4